MSSVGHTHSVNCEELSLDICASRLPDGYVILRQRTNGEAVILDPEEVTAVSEKLQAVQVLNAQRWDNVKTREW